MQSHSSLEHPGLCRAGQHSRPSARLRALCWTQCQQALASTRCLGLLPLHVAYDEENTAVIQDATYLKPGSYVPMTPFKMNACHFLGGLLQCLRLRQLGLTHTCTHTDTLVHATRMRMRARMLFHH